MSRLDLPVAAMRDSVARRDVSASEILEEALGRIGARDRELHAFLRVDEEGARRQAVEVDRRVARGEDPGPLAGVPVAVKDNICVRGLPATCGSRILEAFVSPYDAHVVERLRAAGAVIVGKTNCDEFAMGSSTENSTFGPTRNPHASDRAPGGSSGGSAAAVAAGFVPLALGSDTGGSIRQPAALTGTVGLKPTYGRVSRYGLVAFGSSLDQVGPHARNVRDAAVLLSVLAGRDARDSTSVPDPVPDYLEGIEEGVGGMRLGLPREYMSDGPVGREGCDRDVRARVEEAVAVYRRLGAEVVPVSLPHTAFGIAVYYVVATAEASSNLARYDGMRYGFRARGDGAAGLLETYERSRAEGFGPEVRRRIMLGTFALSSGYYDAYYLRALKVRTLVRRDFLEVFRSGCDAVLGPTSPIPAFKLGEKVSDPLTMYLCDVYTVTANLAGIPGVSIPCGWTEGPPRLPVGLQIQAPPFAEAKLLRIARAYERETAGARP